MDIRIPPLRALLVCLAVGTTMVTGCASTATQESFGEAVDDGWISTKVKANFVEDKRVDATNIKVETFKGVVQLSGFANSQSEIDRAVAIAGQVKGVKSVKNDVRLKTSAK